MHANLCIPAPHWYIGLLAERKVRSKATDLTVIPLIQWEHLSNGQWTDLKVVNTDPNIQHSSYISQLQRMLKKVLLCILLSILFIIFYHIIIRVQVQLLLLKPQHN